MILRLTTIPPLLKCNFLKTKSLTILRLSVETQKAFLLIAESYLNIDRRFISIQFLVIDMTISDLWILISESV